ncbi:MAG: FemAB family XrtA/PEP-CTERM system-associated protein [Gemmataceae bacterium]
MIVESDARKPTFAIPESGLEVRIHARQDLNDVIPRLARFAAATKLFWLSRHPDWLRVLRYGLRHEPYLLEATADGVTRGILPLALVHSTLFGRFLVSLPYLNVGGIIATDAEAARRLIDAGVGLADELRVRYLELRNETHIDHPALTAKQTHKVHLRLSLPSFPGPLWTELPAKVRNQVRKGEKNGLTVAWGRRELLPEFYAVFSENMRDLGTPVYGLGLFAQVLRSFPDRAELCVVRQGDAPLAAALLLHGHGVTEVPSASSLRAFNNTNANMLMYWHLLERAIDRRQDEFDFGRSTLGSGPCEFKEQWGAKPTPSVWQYYVRRGPVGDMRADNPKYRRMVRIWQRLPLRLTRLLGPRIVRGIP